LIARAESLFRRLLDCALDCGGAYYLCYHRFAEPAQLRRAYPGIDEFFALKRKYDPAELFTNQFYVHYGC
jgi:FAD/FMN-containing dehydrogenase